VLSETERFSDWEVSLNDNQGSTLDWFFTHNNTSSLSKGLIDTTHSIIRGLNFTQEDWFLESWLSSVLGSIEDSSGSWDDLTTTSVDSISMEGNIHNVESDTSHVFFSHNGFFGGPLEGSFEGILDFVQVLDGLGLINKEVRTGCFWTEAPDFLSIIDIPFMLVSELSVSCLLIFLSTNIISFNSVSKIITEGFSNNIQSVVLVW